MNCTGLTKFILEIKELSIEFDRIPKTRNNLQQLLEIKNSYNLLISNHGDEMIGKENLEKAWLKSIKVRHDCSIFGIIKCKIVSVFKEHKVYFVNENGEMLSGFAKEGFDMGYGFYQDRAFVLKNGKWFYIDNKGRKIGNFVENGVDYATDFYFSRAKVSVGNKSFYIDTEGNLINAFAPDGFDQANDFFCNRARVRIGDRYYYIDPNGNKIGNEASNGFTAYGTAPAGNYENDRVLVRINYENVYLDLDGRIIEQVED